MNIEIIDNRKIVLKENYNDGHIKYIITFNLETKAQTRYAYDRRGNMIISHFLFPSYERKIMYYYNSDNTLAATINIETDSVARFRIHDYDRNGNQEGFTLFFIEDVESFMENLNLSKIIK